MANTVRITMTTMTTRSALWPQPATEHVEGRHDQYDGDGEHLDPDLTTVNDGRRRTSGS